MERQKSNEPYVADEKIMVTQPFLPPLREVNEYLTQIWDSKWLTNRGKYHEEFEAALAEFLEVPYVALVSNGTLALVVALQVLKITGEVITTPFSFVATTHSLWWNNIRPVFVDVEPERWTLDANKVESAISQKTTAIMPVHVYGYPCNVEKLQEIADIYGLHVIYDAAHAFGVRFKGCSIVKFGDLSVLSFHATKVFNTFEGGAIVCHDEKIHRRIRYLNNFGFAGETKVVAPGINAKMNEFQACLGLLQLKYFDKVISDRKTIVNLYREQLKKIDGILLMNEIPQVVSNYAYFPILIDAKKFGRSRNELYNHLKKYNYFCRRYFYPLISSFNMYKFFPSANPTNLSTATKVAENVLCLPLYPSLDESHVINIANIIKKFRK